MPTPDPRSDRPQDQPDTDAIAVDAVPDETRLHRDADETEISQPSTGGGPHPEEDDEDRGDGRER